MTSRPYPPSSLGEPKRAFESTFSGFKLLREHFAPREVTEASPDDEKADEILSDFALLEVAFDAARGVLRDIAAGTVADPADAAKNALAFLEGLLGLTAEPVQEADPEDVQQVIRLALAADAARTDPGEDVSDLSPEEFLDKLLTRPKPD